MNVRAGGDARAVGSGGDGGAAGVGGHAGVAGPGDDGGAAGVGGHAKAAGPGDGAAAGAGMGAEAAGTSGDGRAAGAGMGAEAAGTSGDGSHGDAAGVYATTGADARARRPADPAPAVTATVDPTPPTQRAAPARRAHVDPVPSVVDVLVVGGGPAGLSAALNLGRARASVLVVDADRPRNAATLNSHGFLTRDGIPPHELRRLARAELDAYPDVRVLSRTRVARLAGTSDDGPRFVAAIESPRAKAVVRARAVLIATGLRETLPEVPGIRGFYGMSLFSCAACDAWELQDRPLALIGETPDLADRARLIARWTPSLTVFTNGTDAVDTVAEAELATADITVERGVIADLEGDRGRIRAVVLEDGRRVPVEGGFVRPRWHPSLDFLHTADGPGGGDGLGAGHGYGSGMDGPDNADGTGGADRADGRDGLGDTGGPGAYGLGDTGEGRGAESDGLSAGDRPALAESPTLAASGPHHALAASGPLHTLDADRDDEGHLVIDRSGRTSVAGLYGAGDAAAPGPQQLIVAAGQGARAAAVIVHDLLGVTTAH